MEVHLDVSCQVTQCYKGRRNKKFPGTIIGFVSSDRKTKYSVFMPKEEIINLVDDYNIKGIFIKIHCCLIYYTIKNFLKDIKKMYICQDFRKDKLSRELFSLFPELKNIEREYVGGKGNKSKAGSYVKHIKRNLKQANKTIVKEDILKKLKSKGFES